jgi:NAD(P)-dependent dehydrogenase (short-subunit alcohol dehydrogenase family)
MMEEKTCLITGSTSGIGKEIALGLAKMKANVVLIGRSKLKCESAIQEIFEKSNSDDRATVRKNNISYIVADLSSQASIRRLAKEFLDSNKRLDVLINNAGVFLGKHTMTVDGLEYTFALNHLAPFLLTNLLLDTIKTTANMSGERSRIITTSSVAHNRANIDFEDLQFKKRRYNGIRAYGQSKLANILFTKELSRRLEGSRVTANCFHPGGVRTNLIEENPWYYRIIWALSSPFLISPEKGAETGIYLASSPDVEEISGKYFVKRKEAKTSKIANDVESAQKLWQISDKLIHGI